MQKPRKPNETATSGLLVRQGQPRPQAEDSLMQPNELTRSLYRCSGTAQKIFVSAVAAFMKNDLTRRNRWIRVRFRETLSALSMTDGAKTRAEFKRAVDEVADLSVVLLDDGNGWHRLNLFEEAAVDWETGETKFKPTEKFATFLEIEHRRGYTVFCVESVSRLNSFYAMRYFEIAMSYRGFKGRALEDGGWAERNGVDLRSSWYFSYSLDELKKLFMLGDGQYRLTANLVRRVVLRPLDELNAKLPEYRFRVQIVRRNNTARGKVLGFVFWVTEVSPGGGAEGAGGGALPGKAAGLPPGEGLPPEDGAEPGPSQSAVDFDATLDFMERMRRGHGEEFARRLAERMAVRKPYELELLLSVEVAFSMYTDGYRP